RIVSVDEDYASESRTAPSSPRRIRPEATHKKRQQRSQRLTGASCWMRKVNHLRHRKHWKNSAALIGDLCTVSSGGKALEPRRRKTLRKGSFPCCWSAVISMLCVRRKAACVLIYPIPPVDQPFRHG